MNRYESAVTRRYGNAEMLELFSEQSRWSTARMAWAVLAEEMMALGAPISAEQVAQMQNHLADIDWERAAALEREFSHDVQAHLRLFGEAAPLAAPIIHFGMTSAFIVDNVDTLLMAQGLDQLERRLDELGEALRIFARRWKGLECAGYTHFQPAALTTLGRRAVDWLQDFAMDREAVQETRAALRLLGARGAVGTGMTLQGVVDGVALDARVARALGLGGVYPISTQTYPRKMDVRVANTLAGIAQSASRVALAIRLLSSTGEVREGFAKRQVGSSAMPWKRNPIVAERICGLARLVMNLAPNAGWNAAEQWLERSLDDSANRRVIIPDLFILVDSIVTFLDNLVRGLEVDVDCIERRAAELRPFAEAELLLREAVLEGQDRREVYDRLREQTALMRETGNREMLREDPQWTPLFERIAAIPLSGRAEEQVEEWLNEY